jgi:squalene-hopene/tetraprenyl-beta-curcumene cyclase
LSWSNFFLACDSILKLLHKIPWKPWRQRAIRRCEEWMVEHMGEESDGLAAIFPAMLNGMIALKALGYSNDHPVLAKANRDFEGLFVDDPQDFRIQPCLSPVWDSAINLVALLESGVDPQREEIRNAITWLESKEVRQRGDWCVNNPGVESSGWAFEFNNGFYPDTDDTMMVLAALARAKAPPQTASDPAKMPFERPLNWLLSFQCKDGGWAAFDKGVTERWLEDVPFADHNAILDPTCSDLTGRMLELLGYLGWQQSSRVVRRAITYLRDTQEADGSWYAQMGVNYVYGTGRYSVVYTRLARTCGRIGSSGARLAGELPE